MKKYFFTLLSALCCLAGNAQDTTRILFIGNSFTYGNNMPQMVESFAASANRPVVIAIHAPGGVSVGDISQGTMAHMNNPVLFSLIRSKAWDYVVIQDNQGRFIRDSAQFSGGSLVVQGHLKIRDSVITNNPCAKTILFGGWAFKNGSPPFGNTGIETINRLLCNYRVLNDTMKEIISPIGEAWIRAVNYLPSINLWDTDDAHPSYAGSYLTAAVIFSTIFELPAKMLNYNGALSSTTAFNLRAFSDSSLFNPLAHTRYNLCGVKKIVPVAVNNKITVPGVFSTYQWFQMNEAVTTGTALNSPPDGTYNVWLRANDGCLIKSCPITYAGTVTGIENMRGDTQLSIYPNPVRDNNFTIRALNARVQEIELVDLSGQNVPVTVKIDGDLITVSTGGLCQGCYLLVVKTDGATYRKKVFVGE